jgi:beta-glucosidase
MNNSVEAFKAGLDLEMPGSKGRFDREVKEAVERGELAEAYIDASVNRLITLIERTTKRSKKVKAELLFNQIMN